MRLSQIVRWRGTIVPVVPGAAVACGHLQAPFFMELAGLEPATSWVRCVRGRSRRCTQASGTASLQRFQPVELCSMVQWWARQLTFSHHRSDRDAAARSKNCSPPRRAKQLCGAHPRASHTVPRVTTGRRRTPPRLPDCRHRETARTWHPDAARNPLSPRSGTAFRSAARVARRLPRRTHA